MSPKPEVILANLELNAADLAEVNKRRDALLAERRGLVHKARDAGVTLATIADAAGVTHQAICNLLNREKARRS